MRKIILNPGQTFGKWTIMESVADESQPRSGYYRCKCECGTIRVVSSYSLRKGLSRSCRCDMIGNTRHGLSSHKLFKVWSGIKYRCYREKSEGFKNYGMRGIRMCEAWLMSFKSFYDWAVSNGWKKGLTVERIDNDGDYSPENCVLATMRVQSRNCRRNRHITYHGKTMPLICWCDELGLKYDIVSQRLNALKWTVEMAFERPVRKLPKRKS